MRFIVVGTSGAGKSTFARALARNLGCPYVELDALFWGPDWTPKQPDVFEELARSAAAGERWVIDGNYTPIRDIVWPRGTHLVWLNFSRATVMLRILRRTISRAATQQPLWHGNRESARRAFFSRKSILLWSATTFGKNRVKYPKLQSENRHSNLTWVELRSPTEAKAFLASHARNDA